MRRWTRSLAALTTLALIGGGAAACEKRSSGAAAVEKPQIASMEASGQAMERAGTTMQAHGQTMLDDSRKTGDQNLAAHGEHWLRDGATLLQAGRWMAMNPTAPGYLVSSPGELAAQGNWQALTTAAQNMLHDPSKARSVDIEALRWNGLAMQGEGQNMVDHAGVMAEEAEAMIQRHGLQGQAADDLRAAARTMREVGGRLTENGTQMVEYADRIRRSMGLK